MNVYALFRSHWQEEQQVWKERKGKRRGGRAEGGGMDVLFVFGRGLGEGWAWGFWV